MATDSAGDRFPNGMRSMNDERTFVDTNVLVYAHDLDAGPRRDVARTTLVDLWARRTGVVSTQVLAELFVTLTRKVLQPLTPSAARQIVIEYSAWSVHRPEASDISAAAELHERHQLAFWDALIVISAQRSGCSRLLSEDLQDRQRFGTLQVIDPFGAAPDS